MPRTRQEICAGAVVFSPNAAGVRYLIIHDSHGNWGFPKGHIERNESQLEAASRELREETGVDEAVAHGPITEIDWVFRDRRVQVHKRCCYFLFETTRTAVRPQVEEGIHECRWCVYAEARRRLTFENTRAVLANANGIVMRLGREASAPRR
jgi:tRNA nucleotidyltransferase (CCA-adding enzyme)